MRCELVAVGTELLLGQVVDTNSVWLSERLAASGIDCHFHTSVGDNAGRIADVLRIALDAEVQLEPDPVALTARVGGGAANGQGAAEQASRALAELARTGITVDNFSLGQPSLDEVFLALTGHPSDPEPPSGPGAPQDLKEAEVSR